MSHVFQATDQIGAIVAALPKAGEVFSRHQIDFCCGGQRQLSAALAEQGLEPEPLLAELDQAFAEAEELKQPGKDWRVASLRDLLDHIVNTHHAYLNTSLPELGQLTTTILRVHGQNHRELAKVHRLFHTLKLDLEQHLITEEEEVFPLIREYEQSGSEQARKEAIARIAALESEHVGAGDILKELRRITADYTVPSDGCGTFQRTYDLLQELESDLFRHIHLENNILHERLRLAGQS